MPAGLWDYGNYPVLMADVSCAHQSLLLVLAAIFQGNYPSFIILSPRIKNIQYPAIGQSLAGMRNVRREYHHVTGLAKLYFTIYRKFEFSLENISHLLMLMLVFW